jgi:hypothetical protein
LPSVAVSIFSVQDKKNYVKWILEALQILFHSLNGEFARAKISFKGKVLKMTPVEMTLYGAQFQHLATNGRFHASGQIGSVQEYVVDFVVFPARHRRICGEI